MIMWVFLNNLLCWKLKNLFFVLPFRLCCDTLWINHCTQSGVFCDMSHNLKQVSTCYYSFRAEGKPIAACGDRKMLFKNSQTIKPLFQKWSSKRDDLKSRCSKLQTNWWGNKFGFENINFALHKPESLDSKRNLQTCVHVTDLLTLTLHWFGFKLRCLFLIVSLSCISLCWR